MSGLIKLRRGERIRLEEMLPVGYAKVMAEVDKLQVEGERLASGVATADGFEILAIEHLDFPIPCRWMMHSIDDICGAPATWSVVCIGCKRETGFLCDRDRDQAMTCPTSVTHTPCGVRGTYEQISIFEPLGRS